MQLAFEMTLDQCEAKKRYQKHLPTPATRLKNLFTGRSDHQPSQKTLLGGYLMRIVQDVIHRGLRVSTLSNNVGAYGLSFFYFQNYLNIPN